ncbi:DGQHR domain-containing protein [Paraburkholderia silvatlantica]|uniref:DGQHR domain-containing protein n=1 Tax=Paraburkholderia silvatlantica TaxID=321895 RepID=A0A2V4V0R9_9BURK|nr:DGQHR domain-containing protein [Paraburkholderia silvatlantica]PYE26366.1 DGQHR domain-containing protein [Paraburkholderia silvatlantica]
MESAEIQISGLLGRCGGRDVFTSFAAASLLAELSFADTFDEASGTGYQRRFNRQHSLEFKKYIQRPGSSTIPLTFNLRPEHSDRWSLSRDKSSGLAILRICLADTPIMSQVDCQHRLGYMAGSDIEFAFMAFIGLSVAEEMEIFRDINGKAKGLNSSLLDSTEARLTGDQLSAVKPELYYAMQLNENPLSVWYRKLDLGGEVTVGTKRIASLRTMQQAVKRFFHEAEIDKSTHHEVITEILINFWKAITYVLPEAWENPRKHLITKGIGVYCLMSLAGDLVKEALQCNRRCDLDYFIGTLSDFMHKLDWTNQGPLMGYGGVKGADAALDLVRHARNQIISSSKNYAEQADSVN